MTRKEFTPRPWQPGMLDHLYQHKRCALWAGMGLGKTTVVVHFLESCRVAGDGPTLVVGPLRVARSVWSDEVKKWEGLEDLRVSVLVGPESVRRVAMKVDADIYTCNYEVLPWLIQEYGDRWPFERVVLDESDHVKGHRVSLRRAKKKDGTEGREFLAGQGSVRAKALAKIAHLQVKSIIELTGTPAPNGLKDLWGQLWFLDRGERLGRTYDAFSQRWFSKGYDGFTMDPLPNADGEIHTKVRDICLTVRAEDWMPIDKPVVNNVYVTLPPKVVEHFKKLKRELFAELKKGTVTAANAAVMTSKCLQLANGALYLDSEDGGREYEVLHDEKIEALRSIMAEVGDNLLVCYEFKSDLERLLRAFPKGRALKSKADEDAFKSGRVPMLFLHPKSGGHGIDGFQHVCNNIVFFGHNWSLGQYLQVIERIGPVRQMQAGKNRLVWVHHILAENTLDEVVMARRETKRDVQDLLLDACKADYGR